MVTVVSVALAMVLSFAMFMQYLCEEGGSAGGLSPAAGGLSPAPGGLSPAPDAGVASSLGSGAHAAGVPGRSSEAPLAAGTAASLSASGAASSSASGAASSSAAGAASAQASLALGLPFWC